jgi:predicted P-loop ATPase/GTPase
MLGPKLKCFNRILAQKPDLVLIESINNTATPFNSEKICETIKLVLAVQPGMVLSFNPQRYFQVLREFAHFNGLVSKTVEDVVNIIKPENIFKIPTTTTFQKDDRLVKKLLDYLNQFF